MVTTMEKLALTSRHILLGMLMTSLWHVTLTQTLQNVFDLRAALMNETASYYKGTRPVTPQTKPVYVQIYFAMKGMGGLNEKSQTMETVVGIRAYWRNEYFMWNPDTNGALTEMLIIQNDQWVPDVSVANSAEQVTAFGHKNLNTWVVSCGKVQWSTLVKVTSNCDIDITYYPFDTQKCDIEFQTEFLMPYEIRLFIHNSNYQDDPTIDYSDLNKDGTWDIIDSAAFDDYTSEHRYKVGEKQTLKYTFLLQRKTTYYVLSLVLPVFFLSFTATLVFALPVDSGEKMGTCITVLLSYAVYLTIVTDFLPHTSLHVSLLGLYLVLIFGLCTFCVIVSTFVLRVNFKPESYSIGSKTRGFAKYASKMGYSYNIFRLIVAPCCTKKPKKEARETCTSGELPVKDPEVENAVTWADVAKALDWAAFLITTFLNVGTTVLFACIMLLGSALHQPTIDHEAVLNFSDFANYEDDYYLGC